ncbi:MAG: IS5 family transposase, partial [Desulfobacteraceae bacterium]|nr:IS5 family transposase [Desulfobacteraceae bacterium]
NRWVRLANKTPWDELVEVYIRSMSSRQGRKAINPRVVIGAMIIKHMLTLSDEETIEQIREKPYLQYFLGLPEFQVKRVFDPSLFVTIRKRLGTDDIHELTLHYQAALARKGQVPEEVQENEGVLKQAEGASVNKGQLIVDATVVPADIKYPTDLDLLHTSRVACEQIIDELYKPVPGKIKPRTYRRVARREYVVLSKKRKKTKKQLRTGIRRQLNFIRRDIKTIAELLGKQVGKPFPLSAKWQRKLWIAKEVYRQQWEMYRDKKHRVQDRIVSFHQPHIRPIVRGKSGSPVEFGAKVSISIIEGVSFLDRLDFNAYTESLDQPFQVEQFKQRHGHYPEVVIADKLYGNRNNRQFLKKHGVRFSGVILGRPPRETEENAQALKSEKRRRKEESGRRNVVEGKFGEGKRKYGMNRVLAKTPETSESWIASILLVMNIAHWMRDILWSFLKRVILA